MFTEVYLELSRTSAIQFFCEGLIGINYFCKKAPSQMFAWFLNMPLDLETATSVLQNKLFLKNFAIFTGKHLCWSPFLIELQAIFCIQTEYCISLYQYLFVFSLNAGRKLKKNKLWLLPFFMAVATYFRYEKVHRTMHTTIVLYLFNICAFKIKSN